MPAKSESVIVSGARTPIGSFQGTLSAFLAPELGAAAIGGALNRSPVNDLAGKIDEVIMGCVVSAGLGQAPARQAAKGANIPDQVGALTINKVCGSSLKAILIADQMIRAGDANILVAGGMESMTNAPYYLMKAREGYRMGNGNLIDGMIHDGLWDPYNNFHMGRAAERCARNYKISREAQDALTWRSYERAKEAQEKGFFAREIVPLTIKVKGQVQKIEVDEEPLKGFARLDKIAQLKSAFEDNGTVTAANASKISDGAAAVVVMHEKRAAELKIKPRCRIVAHAQAALAPEDFTIAPIAALKNLSKVSGIAIKDFDCIEINEAFAVVVEVASRELDLDPAKVNRRGGAIALGHPIGMSGARLVVTLMQQLEDLNLKYGAAAICLGGGEAVAILLERI